MFKNLLTKSLFFFGALALVFTATASASAATLTDGVTFSDSNAWQISFPSVTISNAMAGESLDCSPWSSRVSSYSFQGVCTFKYNPNRTENVNLSVNYSYHGPVSSAGSYPNWWMAEYWFNNSQWLGGAGAPQYGPSLQQYSGPTPSSRATLSVPSGSVSISRPVSGLYAGHNRSQWDLSFHNQFGFSDNPQLLRVIAEPNTDIPLNSTTVNNTNLWLANNGTEFIPLPNNSAPVNWPVIGEASVTSNQTPTCQVKYQGVSQDSFSPTSGDYANRYAFFNLKTTGAHSYDLDCAGSATLSPAFSATGLPASSDIKVAVRGNDFGLVTVGVGGTPTDQRRTAFGNGVMNFTTPTWNIYNVFVPDGYQLIGDPTSYAQIAGFHCATAGRDACWAILSKWMGANNADQWVDTFMATDQADDNWVIRKKATDPSLIKLSLSKTGTSATTQTLAVCPSQSVTVSWQGGNLPTSCTTASNPALAGWNGNSVGSNSSAGTYTLSTPSSSGDYRLGLSCGTNTEAKISSDSSKATKLTVLPASHQSCFTLTATDSANAISGLVTDGSGNAISGVTVSVNNGAWTAVSGSNGAWSIPASTHNLVKGGSFGVAVVLPAGYQSVVAKNARTSAASYQWQILDVNCADNSASPSCRDWVGTWLKNASLLEQTVLNGQIHDLSRDNTYDFVLNREPNLSAACSALPTIVDINTPATLTASATGGSGNYTYDWSYNPDPGTSSINVSYATAGTKVETVTVRDLTRNLSSTASCILNVANPSTPVPATPSTPPACSDGLDNDADGKVDSADPGCLIGGQSYDANDNDETDPPVTPVTPVTPDNNPDNTPDGTPDTTPDITVNQSPAVNITAFYASPSSVPTNNLNTTLYWEVENATRCEIDGGLSYQSRSVTVNPAGSTFSLTCTGAGQPDSASVTVNTYQPAISCSVNEAVVPTSLTKNILKGGLVNVANFFSCSGGAVNTTVTGPLNNNISISDGKIFPTVSGRYLVKAVSAEDGFIINGTDTIELNINVFAPDVEETN